MATYRLSSRADADVADIAAFGIENFGVEQARRFRDGLLRRFATIAQSPRMYPAVDDVRPGHRRSVYKGLSIYYRIDGGGVVIVRVLGRQDAPSTLDDPGAM